MGIDLEKLGFSKNALKELLENDDQKIKLRLGDGTIVDLLKEHLDVGIEGGRLAKIDDHDKVGVRVDDHERVRSLHTKAGRAGVDSIYDDLINTTDGVFIGNLDENEFAKLKAMAGDILKAKDLVVVKKIINKD